MKTLGLLADQRRRDDDNNFLLLRLAGALLVVFGHSYGISGNNYVKDFLGALDPQFYTHRLGLFIFFSISGFLVAGSFDRLRSPGRFLKNRALRIFPGLIVCVAICTAVVGPIYSSLSLHDYFADPTTWKYFLVTASAGQSAPDLPSVSFGPKILEHAVNGSLWTIAIEVRLYLLIGLVGLLSFGRGVVASAAVAALGALALVGYAPLINGGGWPYILAGVFGMGALMYYNRYTLPVTWMGAALLTLVAWLSHELPSFYYVVAVAITYTVFCIAYSKPLRLPSWIEDYSYGTYLYAFPIQQVLSHAIPGIGPISLACLAMPLALGAGVASWYLIEKPFLRLKGDRLHPVSIDATPQAHPAPAAR